MKKINMELKESKKAQGYTMRANVNADYSAGSSADE